MLTPEQLENLLKNKESVVLEFKEAKNNFDSRDRSDYCAGIANSGGGYLILGVNDKGKVIGTNAYKGNLELIPNELKQKINVWIEVFEVKHKEGRVVVFKIPSRSIGERIKSDGHYFFPIRKGESLVEMDDNTTREILNEKQPDYSSDVCPGLTIKDLDTNALNAMQKKWAEKEGKKEYLKFSQKEVLEKLSLMRNGNLTIASLILCGKKEKITEMLPEAEIRFAWKADANKLDFDFSKDWRAPFLNIFDEIWEVVNARNSRIPFEEGFFEGDIWSFDQKSIREAVLNAVAHRDYQERGSIFIEASAEYFIAKSPGGFLPGVTSENAIDSQGKWRNRLLMETLGSIGLVERFGHGLDRIFQKSISDGKGLPLLKQTKSNFVELTIPTQVKDKNFVYFLEKIAKQTQLQFDFVKDLIFLEEIREKQFSEDKVKRDKFLKLGIIEKIGKGRGMKYILSGELYNFLDKKGEYTRRKWLSKAEQTQLLLNFFKQHKKGRMSDLRDGLFQGKLKNTQILRLLDSLKAENKVYFDGKQRSPSAYWRLKEL